MTCSALLICNKKGNIKKNLWRLNQNYDDTTGVQCTINTYFAIRELQWKIFVLGISWENMHLVCTQNFLIFFFRFRSRISMCTAQKMKFSIQDIFSKCDQICRKLRIWSHLLKKSLTENFIFLAVFKI